MKNQQPRRIKPSKLAILLILVTVFVTLFSLYSPSFKIFKETSLERENDNVDDSISTTELLEQSNSSVESFNDSSLSENRKSLEDNADDGQQVYNSSLSEDIKLLEEDNVQQDTSPNWPEITVEDLLTKEDLKKKKKKNKKKSQRDRQTRQRRARRSGRTREKGKESDERQQAEEEKSGSQEWPDALVSSVADKKSCDIFEGEWVPNPEAPYYTNITCKHIQEHQNCIKFGRPDKDFMKWRWKPDDECELPLFNPLEFLELLRGKSLAFVGDSVSRNHMQSLICLLSTAVIPEDVSDNEDQNFKRFKFPDYNFTMSIFWSPYLVRAEKTDPNNVTQPFKLFLDEFDEYWPSQVESYDYIILSAGQWFFRPTMFYLNNTLTGCLYCPDKNVAHLSSQFSYRRAFRTAFSAINSLKNFKGVTFLRTYATSHFEGGPWDKGGDCVRTKPLTRDESGIEDYSLEIYKIQLEELKIAQKIGWKRGLKFRLFDATRPMSLRPDGHPSKYGHSPKQKVQLAHDCVHWCLPGPIDSLNDLLQELINRETEPTTS